MAYRFKLLEPFDEGIRRIGLQQIDRLLEELQSAQDAGAAIHNTRKGLKRIRALLRLARPGLGEAAYGAENARFRDIGRTLAAARDQYVLMETLNKLESVATGRTKSAFAAARTKLARARDAAALDQHNVAIAQALQDLREARGRMAALPLDGASFDAAFEGLARAYRQANRSFDHAFDAKDGEAIHEFRKRVQHHWRHMTLLSLAWPELLEARIATARQLSALLGEDHDIAVMVSALEGKNEAHLQPLAKKSAPVLTDSQRKLTLAFASSRQQALRRTAKNLGRRLFAENADAFRDRMKLYWVSAGSDQTVETTPA